MISVVVVLSVDCPSSFLRKQCALVLVDGVCIRLQAHESWCCGRRSTRPVLKHGPRSLTCTQVIGPNTKPKGEMKVNGRELGLKCDPDQLPMQDWTGATLARLTM